MLSKLKTIQLFLAFVFTCFLYTEAADLPLTFESGTNDITNFDGGVLTIEDNTQKSGINTSNKVAQMVKNDWEIWGGSYITLDNNIDFNSGNTFKVKVFSPRIGAKVFLKVENANDADINFSKEVETTKANEWEELSFDFNGINTANNYRKIVLIFDNGTNGDGSANFTFLIDDITLVQVDDVAPTTPAPTPPSYHSSKVISIFSEAFNTLDGTNFNPWWDPYQTTVGSIVEVQGNEMVKLRTLNFHGFELLEEVNAAGMKFLHIDVWTANETTLDIYPITRSGERKASLTPLTQNTWNSYDIRLSDLVSQNFNLADLYQFKFIGAGGNTVYIDNLYFYDDNATLDTENPTAFTASVGNVTYNSIELILNATDNSGAIEYTITVGGMTTTIGAVSGVQKSYEFTRLPSDTEFTFSLTANDLAGNSAANNPLEIIQSTGVGYAEPAVSSPTPPSRNASDVISVFSDVYVTILNTNFNPWWNQNTWFYSVQVGGNEVLMYENFNYQGIEIGSKVDASDMTYLHVDLWTPNETSLSISPISESTGERAFNFSPINQNQWNSYDIPLSSFTIQGLSMSDILHLKFVGSGKSIIYLDNIYFHKGTPTAIDDVKTESLKLYPNPVLDILTIEGLEDGTLVEIYGASGSLLKKVYISGGRINVADLAKGVYFISANGITSKLIKK
ncbi:T9SS type A sorting domain-containing protein [Carboxylicivirga sp. N1Y90]|uniref:T9SS type A sorting domain-containing protein n=1 Tax=Carboxylicivirga fragile TaxID=3417571 RepID=UPI003D33AD21|nr:T9SS type A sorting domain-containing protein [Marinilabiliaceae bacterium N1Y90]